MKSAENFEKTVMYLSVLRYVFKSRSKQGYYDLNRNAEGFFRDIFNLANPKWKFEDLNEIKKHYPAIDLGDKDSRIGVQITAQNDSLKIKDTIKAFNEHKLYNSYQRLVVFILTEKKSYTTSFETGGYFTFDQDKDIWDIDDLLERIEKLTPDVIGEIHEYVKRELPSIVNVFATQGSPLAKIEAIEGKQPLNSVSFLKFLSFDKIEFNEGHCEVLALYKKINSLPKQSREYLYILISKSQDEKLTGYERLWMLVDTMKKHVNQYDGDSEMESGFNVLKSYNLVDLVEEEQDAKIVLTCHMLAEMDMFFKLKEYLADNDLKSLIINCDFTLLD